MKFQVGQIYDITESGGQKITMHILGIELRDGFVKVKIHFGPANERENLRGSTYDFGILENYLKNAESWSIISGPREMKPGKQKIQW